MFSTLGYRADSPDNQRSYNLIPSGVISMSQVPHPIWAIDNLGNSAVLYPQQHYQFPGQTVLEIPIKNKDMRKKIKTDLAPIVAQNGGHMFWDGNKWVHSVGTGTYANGTYFAMGGNSRYSANGGPNFPVMGSAPIFQVGGYQPSLYPPYQNGGPVPGAEIVQPFAMDPGHGDGIGLLEEYAADKMKHGGKKKDKKLTPQQLQMLVAAMQPQQGMQPGQQMMPPGPPQQQPISPQQYQMMMQQQQQGPAQQPPMKTGGIHIAESKKGTFTSAAKKHGKSVQGFASQVLAHKENYSPAMVRKANFARNASHWKKQYGGNIYEQGGYAQGSVHELEDHEIQNLINQGYKIKYL